MTTLIKNMQLAVPGVPAVPGTPAYCVDVPESGVWMSFFDQHRLYGTPLPPVPPGVDPATGTPDDWYLTHGSRITVMRHHCYPAVAGVPGVPSRPPEFNIGWNGGAISAGINYLDAIGQYSNGQYQFRVPHDVVGVVTGLNDYPADSEYYGDIKYGLYFTLGTVVVCENGVQIGFAVPYETADVFTIVRLGDEIRYFQNSTLLRSFVPATRLGALWADASVYFGGDKILEAGFLWDISPEFAIVSGEYAGDLGDFIVAAGDDETAGSAALDLGALVLDAYVSSAGSYAGDLGEFAVAAYDVHTVFADLHLGDFVTSALPQPFEPDYAGVAIDLGEISTFALALNGGDVPDVALDLGELYLYTADDNYGIAALDLDPLNLFAFGSDGGANVGVVVLPAFRTSMQINAGPRLSAMLVLPELEVSGYTGGYAEIELPALEIEASATVPAVMRGTLTLPALNASGAGKSGVLLRGTVTLPALQITSRAEFSSAANWGLPGQRGLYLPALEVSGTGYEPAIVTGDIDLPALGVTGEITAGVYNYGYIVLPALDTPAGLRGQLTLPALAAAGRLSPDVVVTRRAWVMNLANGAMTEFENFAFRAMGSAHGKYWGIGMDGGLWEMGGDTDNEEPIAWEWLSGITDFDMVSEKGLKALYLDGVIRGLIEVTVISDDAVRVYDHDARDNYNHQPQRVKMGMGVRSRSFGFGMASVDGEESYIELDKATPEYIVTKRYA